MRFLKLPLKRTLLIALALFALLSATFAEESESNIKDTFSFGTFATVESKKSGGGIEFAFPIFQKNAFFIRPEFAVFFDLTNAPSSDGKMLGLNVKLHFGSLKRAGDFAFRTYGYAKSVLGATMDATNAFFTAPVVLELGGAGGFEFLFSPKQSFFSEFGGGATIASFGEIPKENIANGSFSGAYVSLTLGMKHYFGN